MGLFGRGAKHSEDVKTEEHILKDELQGEVESLQNQFRSKQGELAEISDRLDKVREEYDTTVTNLMAVKKEIIQKKMELGVIQREYGETKSGITSAKPAALDMQRAESELETVRGNLEKMQQELKEAQRERDMVKSQTLKEQELLEQTKSIHVQVKKEMAQTNAKLYNVKRGLSGVSGESQDSDFSQDVSHPAGTKSETAGIIEAASAVVGSLKSRLCTAEEELETVRNMLEKEKQDHKKTIHELEKLKDISRV